MTQDEERVSERPDLGSAGKKMPTDTSDAERFAQGSALEMTCVLISVFIYIAYYVNAPYVKIPDGMSVNEFTFSRIIDYPVIVSISFVVLEIFTHILLGYPIFVSLVRYFRSKAYISNITSKPFVLEDHESSTMFSRHFVTRIGRSEETYKIAQRRPAALLFVGTSIAILGLIFFVVTIPSIAAIVTGNANQGSTGDALEELVDLSPRLLMLLFIQVLAGFFLRQYRSSMEELRYYESALQSREAELAAYFLIKEMDSANKAELLKSLLEHKGKDFIRLQQGETTMLLEAQKLESNEFKGVVERAFDFLKGKSDTATTLQP